MIYLRMIWNINFQSFKYSLKYSLLYSSDSISHPFEQEQIFGLKMASFTNIFDVQY